MTEKQPEALRLADALESCGCLADEATYDNAAAELRRLDAVEKQRDELLEALKGLDEAYCRASESLTTDERKQDRQRLMAARAAIAKATGATQ